MINYDKLNKQLFNAVANNAGPKEVPEMKNIIKDYLSQFSGQINNSVNKLVFTADNDSNELNGLAHKQKKLIENKGNHELNNLADKINTDFDSKQINTMVTNGINQRISKINNDTMTQINQYFLNLRTKEKKVDQLSIKVNSLYSHLQNVNKELKSTSKKFWYGISITIIVTVCVCWLFL